MAETKSEQSGADAPPRKRERKDNRPEEIVAAAFEEFAAKGYAATKVEDVATRARVSKGLPYLYFKTKEELFKAVIRSVITSHFDIIREQMERTDLPVEAFLKGPFLAFIQELVGSSARSSPGSSSPKGTSIRSSPSSTTSRSCRAASRPSRG